MYYVDLTLRDGISLNEAIIQAKQIDEQSKQAGFYQEALDFTARKGFGKKEEFKEILAILRKQNPDRIRVL